VVTVRDGTVAPTVFYSNQRIEQAAHLTSVNGTCKTAMLYSFRVRHFTSACRPVLFDLVECTGCKLCSSSHEVACPSNHAQHSAERYWQRIELNQLFLVRNGNHTELSSKLHISQSRRTVLWCEVCSNSSHCLIYFVLFLD
jgi:hypothetical protein